MRYLVVRCGMSPLDVGDLTLSMISTIVGDDGSDVITLADERSVERFLNAWQPT